MSTSADVQTHDCRGDVITLGHLVDQSRPIRTLSNWYDHFHLPPPFSLSLPLSFCSFVFFFPSAGLSFPRFSAALFYFSLSASISFLSLCFAPSLFSEHIKTLPYFYNSLWRHLLQTCFIRKRWVWCWRLLYVSMFRICEPWLRPLLDKALLFT